MTIIMTKSLKDFSIKKIKNFLVMKLKNVFYSRS